jgi:hypothetical protein
VPARPGDAPATAQPNADARTRYGVAECSDPLHNLDEAGRWFFRMLPGQKRCPLCNRERPNLKAKQQYAALKLRRAAQRAATRPTPGCVRPAVPEVVWQLFELCRPALEALLPKEGWPDNEQRVERSFGLYGKIRCTEAQVRLSYLDVACDDPKRALSLPMLSLLTGIKLDDIIAMREGGGSNPNYPNMRAHFQGERTSYEIQATVEKEMLELKGGDLNAKLRSDAMQRLLMMKWRILDRLPDPPKSAEISFGDDDAMPAGQLAKRLWTLYVKSSPGLDGRDPGPGPVV